MAASVAEKGRRPGQSGANGGGLPDGREGALEVAAMAGAALDHVTLKVADYARAAAFYDAALKPLGLTRQFGDGQVFAGYGAERPFFWIGQGHQSGGSHVAFAVADRALVDAFYAAALTAGGRDNGSPGLRVHYHPNYYGAFVLDPDGHNVEAVCHAET